MIIWSGYGFLTPLIAVVCLVLGYALTPTVGIAIGFLLAAVVNWFVGKRFNAGPVRNLRDEDTGEQVAFKRTHTFFFIGMEWWSIGFAVLGLLAFFSKGAQR